MCGLAGMVRLDGADVDQDELTRMTRTLAHRGPDGEGVWREGPFGLGHRRLAIIDLSEAGAQPLCNDDGSVWVAFNGEIYNFRELRAELEAAGYVFRSGTDTEVIVHAYRHWGRQGCLERFVGMFAFALVDLKEKALWLVRDRLGVKPLFYFEDRGRLLFGSEIKAVLAADGVPRELDREALAYYLALNYVPAPFTLFKGVRQVMPAQEVWWPLGQAPQRRTYWRQNLDKSHTPEGGWPAALQEMLKEAVGCRLVSDVPFGAFLSGGVDSSTVAYWMARGMDQPLKTFSVHFGEPGFDEDVYARRVAAHLGAEHHQMLVQAHTAEVLPQIVWHAEEPTADSSMVAVWRLAEQTRQHVTMVQSGDGADELFAGYETYTAHHLHRWLRHVPRAVRNGVLKPMVGLLPSNDAKVSLDFKLRRFLAAGDMDADAAHASWRMIFDASARRRLLAPVWEDPAVRADVLDLYREVFAEAGRADALDRMLYVDTRFYLPSDMLVKVDRMTMAHGLEAREPMLDHRLADMAGAMPSHWKLRRWTQKKYVLKEAMKGKLPADILWRKKAGFNVPNARWIKGELKDFVRDHLSADALRPMGLFDLKEVDRLLDEHMQEKADYSHQLWGLLTLSLWWQRFMAGGASV